MLSFERVFLFLPNLTTSQLKKVQERVEFLLIPSMERKKDRGLDIFYNSVVTTLKKYYSRTYPTTKDGLKKNNSKLYKVYLNSYSEFSNYLHIILNRNPSVEELSIAGKIFTDLIAEDLQKRNIRPSLQAILTNTASFPLLLERAFPGYVNAGSAFFIFESLDRFNLKKLKAEKNSKEV